ncbi:holo-ACP synthase [Streptomyces sp. NRRL_B-2557]|uniref:holo-ACP synthase n=1 Tax=Streptomyces sp. NRRL_B-2557 TaxID=3028698 RepID=UPI0029BCF819|nr:holo-ACP synthase [Streptomyces sp. NRRL_B-2557]MDX2748537.1 holo-ACP synthase [Streptomyces sp. NRRL_B-2557]
MTARLQPTGVGLDVLDRTELDRLLERRWFLRYCYAPEELGRARDLSGRRRQEYLAGRFAAKEAVLKALGRGLFQGIAPHDILIDRSPDGAPHVELRDTAADATPPVAVLVSITHKGDAVAAVALTTPRTPQEATHNTSENPTQRRTP